MNGFRRFPALKKFNKDMDQQKGKGGTIVPSELSTLLMPWEHFSLDFFRMENRSTHVFQYHSNPISDMLKANEVHYDYFPKRMPPASPLPTSPLPLVKIFNPETPRKSRVESDKSKFLDIRINLWDAPVCPIATPITPIITTDFSFSVQPQEYSAPEAVTPSTTPITPITTDFSFSVHSAPEASFVTPSTTPITPTTDFFFSPNPEVYSAPEAFTTPSTTPITPTTTDNDEEQVSTATSIADKQIMKERKEPLRRSARIAEQQIRKERKEPLQRSARVAAMKDKPSSQWHLSLYSPFHPYSHSQLQMSFHNP
jgi:hypothetical protein